MIDVNSLRHPKEQTYFGAGAVVGGIIWLIILFLSFGTILIWGFFLAFFLWIFGQFLEAQLFGNSVRVSEKQYPEIYNIIQDCSKSLNLSIIPKVFIVNSNGIINAMAIKVLSKKYVLLYSELIDLMLLNKEGIGTGELKMIIGHELAHHAAGHTSNFKNILLTPARYIPFFGNAYSRACELTADRIGAVFTKDSEASKRALVAMVCGSKALTDKTNIKSFLQQEESVPSIAGFISELYSSHPRMTIRIKELESTKIKGLVDSVPKSSDLIGTQI